MRTIDGAYTGKASCAQVTWPASTDFLLTEVHKEKSDFSDCTKGWRLLEKAQLTDVLGCFVFLRFSRPAECHPNSAQ